MGTLTCHPKIKNEQNVPQVWDHGRSWLFDKLRKSVKEEKLQIVFFQFQMLEFLTQDGPLWCYSLYFIIYNGDIGKVDMTGTSGTCFQFPVVTVSPLLPLSPAVAPVSPAQQFLPARETSHPR